MSPRELRGELACAGEVRFLNYAATAPMLATGAAAMERVAREGTRPLAEHFTAWLALVERARREAAGSIGARVDEITFTTSTSTALSLIAAAVRWRPGDRVLHPADEFPSNRFVWQNLEALGVRAEAIAPESGIGFAEQLAARDLEGVRLIALSAVSYRDGRRLDVEAVSRLARERNILVAVDGIQAVGAVPVDVRQWGCDFLACGGQKWLLGPIGSAFLYIARERLSSLHVPTVGWASSRHAGDPEARTLEWAEGAMRFEAGLPDVAAIAGLGACLERLARTGWESIFARIALLRSRLADELGARGLEIRHVGLAGAHAGIVTLPLDEQRLAALAPALERRQVVVTRRRAEVRIAAHAITSDDEIGALLEAVDEAVGRSRSRRAGPTHPDARPIPRQAAPPSGGPWRRAVVTGASRGLGAAIAAELSARGVATTLIGRDRAALDDVAAELRRASSAAVETVALDLSDPDALRPWLDHQRSLEDVDLLVNNAARADASLFVETGEDAERATFQTNLFAPMALSRAVLPGMIARGRGWILNVATAGARNALPLFSTYAASKAALWAWSEALGRELEGTGIHVTTFVPPHMDTATRRQLGRRALGYYDPGTAGDSEGHRPGQADRLHGVARRALDAAARGSRLAMPRRARWEVLLNALWPTRVEALVRKRWKGAGAGRRPSSSPH